MGDLVAFGRASRGSGGGGSAVIIGIRTRLPWALQDEKLNQDTEAKETLPNGHEMNENGNFPNSLANLQNFHLCSPSFFSLHLCPSPTQVERFILGINYRAIDCLV